MEIAETLRELEASLLTNAVRKNRARVADLLAEDFREFGRSGTAYTKPEILTFLQEEEEIRVTMADFICQPVAEDVVLATYRSERTEPDGKILAALRSSLWVWRDARWQMVFHQGTPISVSAETRVKV
jgi:hypothetical protein